MNKMILLTSVLALQVGCFSPKAVADFKYIGPSEKDYKSAQLFERRVLKAGAYSANRLPIGIVLKLIAGQHVSVDFGQDLDQSKLVSFKGGRPRTEILDEILSPLGFVWHYRDNELFIRSSREMKVSEAFNRGVPIEDRFQRPVTWKVPAGVTLKTLVREWAARARVTVDWKVTTPITLHAAATIDGDLPSALEQLFEALGPDVPVIMSHLYTRNKVLKVWERGQQ